MSDIPWCETSNDKFSVTPKKFIDTAFAKTSKIKEQDMVSLVIQTRQFVRRYVRIVIHSMNVKKSPVIHKSASARERSFRRNC